MVSEGAYVGPVVYPGMATISAAVGFVEEDVHLSRLGSLHVASPSSVTKLSSHFTVEETEAQIGAGTCPSFRLIHTTFPFLHSGAAPAAPGLLSVP